MTATYRYRPAILEELACHGLVPRTHTPPACLRAAINDLYRHEIRRLRDACRAGAFPTRDLPSRVVALRKRYVLLSIPVDAWVERDHQG